MRTREYGQFCGLARALEVLGQRWTVLVLRDLLVGPRRYSDLLAGLPGIPTNVLAARLKELEADGLVVRETRAGSDRSVVYRTTARAEELRPALDALSRWGAAGMREPRPGEVVTDTSLVGSLRVAAEGRTPPARRRAVTYEVRVGPAIAHATVARGQVSVQPGSHPDPDLVVIGGLEFRDLLAGVLDADTALANGAAEVIGDPAMLADFAATFTVPYTDTLLAEASRISTLATVVAERVDVRTAREMMRAGDTVIDVRRPSEYASGHIAGALNVPIEQLDPATLPAGQLLTTCSMGGRGGRAADLLDRAGRAAFSIDGGTKAWQAAGFPIAFGPQP